VRAVTWLGRAVVGLTSAAVLTAVGVGWVTYRSAVNGLVTDDVIAAGPAQADRQPRTDTTILLVGMDSRTDAKGDPLPREVLDELHAGDADGHLSTDTMILVHVPADQAKHAFAVSLPRDSFVDIAGGFGTHKLNSAYARAKAAKAAELSEAGADESTVERKSTTAGRRNLIATVSALTGMRIDHYAEINLLGFSELTKAVGGVPVCLNGPVHDPYSGANFRGGPQTVRGVSALKFVRQRHHLPNGDLDRVRRQQAFLAGLANRLFSAGTLADPGRLGDLVDVLTKSVVLDRHWDLLGFAQQAATLTGDRIQFSTIPTVRPDLDTPEDGSAVEVDPGRVLAYFRGLQRGGTVHHGHDKRGKKPHEPRPGLTAPMDTTEQPITAGGVPCVN
jgi:LCP family protein required for cell wall assembly